MNSTAAITTKKQQKALGDITYLAFKSSSLLSAISRKNRENKCVVVNKYELEESLGFFCFFGWD